MSLISLFGSIMGKFVQVGYKTDQQGIMKRYINERKFWDKHIQKCKSFILLQTKGFNSGKVAVLGSGWLLDVPIDELLDRFDEVWLFDIHHPPQIKKRFELNNKVKFIKVDLTNKLSNKARKVKDFKSFLSQLKDHIGYNLPGKFDFVLSVNLLNQLDIILCDYLKRRFKTTDRDLVEVRQIIQKEHIEIFQSNKGCLITDTTELYINHKNEVVKEINLLYTDVSKLSKSKTWIWVFDTHNNYHQKFNTSFRVCAFSF